MFIRSLVFAVAISLAGMTGAAFAQDACKSDPAALNRMVKDAVRPYNVVVMGVSVESGNPMDDGREACAVGVSFSGGGYMQMLLEADGLTHRAQLLSPGLAARQIIDDYAEKYLHEHGHMDMQSMEDRIGLEVMIADSHDPRMIPFVFKVVMAIVAPPEPNGGYPVQPYTGLHYFGD